MSCSQFHNYVKNSACHYPSFAVPSPIRNLNVTQNGTHVIFSWEEPEMPNGALSYSLMIVAVDLATGDQVINTTRSLPGSETSFILDFELYTEFNLTVTPVTGAGDGDTSSVSIQTDQGGT